MHDRNEANCLHNTSASADWSAVCTQNLLANPANGLTNILDWANSMLTLAAARQKRIGIGKVL